MQRLLSVFILSAAFVWTLLAIPGTRAVGIEIFSTSYNPAPAQTDSSPCVGASGRNLCTAAREGDRTIALSRDLLYPRGPYRWHDKVRLVSEVPQCNGVYSVEDTLHRRYSRRADLFFLSRADNTSCAASVERVYFPSSR